MSEAPTVLRLSLQWARVVHMMAWTTYSKLKAPGIVLLAAFPVLLPSQPRQNVVVEWNNAALEGVRSSKLGPPMVSRALAIVHTCIYDAWAAYDDRALGTQPGDFLRVPRRERVLTRKNESVSFAAYRALVDLFPASDVSVFRPLMTRLGYDPEDQSMDPRRPSGLGNRACQAVLNVRHHDGSNQLGDQSPSGIPYSDYTGYEPTNAPSPVPTDPSLVSDPNRWQPLQYVDATGALTTQSFVGAQWFAVKPFALRSGSEFRAVLARAGPATFGSSAFFAEVQEMVNKSANLTDKQKMIAEYFADGPHSELPPGHWDLFAQFVSSRDSHTVDEDARMFFVLTNAIFDAGIAAWDAKRAFDSVRPATAVPYVFNGEQIKCWGGPGKGTVTMDGRFWIPYQVSTFPTPPFPEFISGHSSFSAAGAEVLKLFTGSDVFGGSVTFAAGDSNIEPGITPASPVTLEWRTFTDAANEAGMSRRFGGIHFKAADLAGRALGRAVAEKVWRKAQGLWSGQVLLDR